MTLSAVKKPIWTHEYQLLIDRTRMTMRARTVWRGRYLVAEWTGPPEQPWRALIVERGVVTRLGCFRLMIDAKRACERWAHPLTADAGKQVRRVA
jgi:hypothetical protein